MAKIKTIKEISLRTSNQVVIIPLDTLAEVSEEMAVYFCNEDIDLLPLSEQKKNSRLKHATRTPVGEQGNPHQDFTNI